MTRSGEFGRLVAAAMLGALVVSVLPAVAAQVGDPLALGEVNSVDGRTDLKGAAKGANLQIKNTGNSAALTAKADKNAVKAKATSGPVAVNAKASRNAIKIKVDPGQSPIKVNGAAGTAINLSADLLDGMDSTAFLAAGGTAVDSDLLDGLDSSAFLAAGGTAADSDLLDGMDSSAFLAAGGTAADSDLLDGNDSSAFLMPSDVVAAHAGGEQSEEVDPTDEVVRSVSLTAPAPGVVIVNSTANGSEVTAGVSVRCSITTGTTVDDGFRQEWESGGTAAGGLGQLAGTRGFDVAAGLFTVNLVCDTSAGPSLLLDSALTAIFIPTG